MRLSATRYLPALALVAALAPAAPSVAQQQPFAFTNVHLKLLERQFERLT
jgi:hypothetical protein